MWLNKKRDKIEWDKLSNQELASLAKNNRPNSLVYQRALQELIIRNDLYRNIINDLYQNNFHSSDKKSSIWNFVESLEATTDNQQTSTEFDKLSSQEKAILKLMTQGYSNQEIAEKLFSSKLTTVRYITRIFIKLQSHSRAEVIAKVQEAISQEKFDF